MVEQYKQARKKTKAAIMEFETEIAKYEESTELSTVLALHFRRQTA